MEKRFPNIDWFCDHCGAYLNYQAGFDDRRYVWKCTKCGFKSSISSSNIVASNKMDSNGRKGNQ